MCFSIRREEPLSQYADDAAPEHPNQAPKEFCTLYRDSPTCMTLRWRQSETNVGLKVTTEMTQTDQIAQIADSENRMTSIPSQIGSSSFKRSRNSAAAMPQRSLSSVGKAPALLTSQATIIHKRL
jgi:hypothetical protein